MPTRAIKETLLRQWALAECVAESPKLKGSDILKTHVLVALPIAFGSQDVPDKIVTNDSAMSTVRRAQRAMSSEYNSSVRRTQGVGAFGDATDSTDLSRQIGIEVSG